ncbi:MAG: carboxyl transferase domain-containing protein [Planctomycetota bacterium]
MPDATAEPTQTPATLREANERSLVLEANIRMGGGAKAIDRQHKKGRLTARERVARLVDGAVPEDAHATEIPGFMELGLWAAEGMYREHGGAPGAGVVTGIGEVQGRRHMIIANDATVKAGAFFPMTCKKIIRAQHVARMARLPLIYLVDSAGVYLPLQEDVFPDTDDFGRIFYLNSVMSAEGIQQTAAIMGFCVAGGGYLPVLCDTLLMTEGSGLYLAGPALVKAAIGQEVSDEELGGATMHAAISGTIDFKEADDEACLTRVREVVGKGRDGETERRRDGVGEGVGSLRSGEDVYDIFTDKAGQQYDVRDILACVVDARALPNAEGHESLEPDFDEYKAEYGQSLVCGYARIGGHACGIVANQCEMTQRTQPGGKAGPSKAAGMPRVIYDDSADKAARFIMDCNQRKIPLVFIHDTTGFMVGRDSEQAGIIRSGAKLVNAMSNCVVPKIVLITGSSYGAGNYAMCGRAFEPFLSLAWPAGKCAVMGAAQSSGVLATIEERSRERKGEVIDEETHKQILEAVRASYNEQQDIHYGAARGWVDRIIQPHRTRQELIDALASANQGWDYSREFKTGVLQT